MADNVFTRKIGPLPMWSWVAIIGGVVVVWALYEQHKQSSAAASSTSANTTPPQIDQFAITVPPEQEPAPPATATTPTPEKEDEPASQEHSFKTNRAATLAQVAKSRHWTPAQLKAVEKQDKLKASSKLRKGQVIKVPWAR
jgi:hypothetical protein